jgi:hypothetical protein
MKTIKFYPTSNIDKFTTISTLRQFDGSKEQHLV